MDIPTIPDDAPFTPEQRAWLNGFIAGLYSQSDTPPAPAAAPVAAPAAEAAYSRQRPFPAKLLVNRKLNAPGSAKDTRHIEISLAGSGLAYEIGDALGVAPTNCPEVAAEVLKALRCTGEESVPDAGGRGIPLRQALVENYEITKIPRAFLEAMAERSGDAALQKLLTPECREALDPFLRGREIIDLLVQFSSVRFEPGEFVGLLKKLQPRLYSIASSLKAHPHEVHLTVAVVEYESLGRKRKGVCSTYLAQRVTPADGVPVFVHTNKSFRLPADGNRPIIMIGPGTGIAPFRAFLEERKAVGARGRNWLFFGDQHAATDFLYREEFEAMKKGGVLTRLDTAFSRDQSFKIYVQDRIRENAREIYAWLQAGAHFYVCGEAGRMARDVDRALHEVVQKTGGKTPEQAAEYVKGLQAEKRYQRDVY